MSKMIGLIILVFSLFFTHCASEDSKQSTTSAPSGSVCDVNCASSCTVHGNETCDERCSPAFTNTLDDFACIKCPQHCNQCSRGNTATTIVTVCDSSGCEPGFYLYNQSCTACPANCLKCNPAGTCETDGCKPRFNNSANGQCVACPDFCERCNATGSVAVCLEGACSAGTIRTVDGQNCLSCPVNCEDCFIVGNITYSTRCRTAGCSRGFGRLSNGSCAACPAQCDRCHYEGTVGDWTMVCNVDGCLTQFTANSVDGQCVKCPANCDHCAAVDNSTLCNFGGCSTSFGRRFDGSCTECQPNCDRCVFSGPSATHSCLLCADKHAPADNGTCLSCPENCAMCHVSGGVLQCDGCETKFTKLQNGICSACPSNCKMCSFDVNWDEVVCDAAYCETNYFLPSAANTGPCYPCPANCTRCSGRDTSSAKCADSGCEPGTGFGPANGSCQACPAFCLSCTYNNNSKQFMCNADGCAVSYLANSEGLCDGCGIPNCLRCTANNTDNSCNPTGCAARFTHTNNRECCACAKHCSDCTQTSCGNCSAAACDPGFGWTPNDKQCRNCPLNCVGCSYDAYSALEHGLSCSSNGCEMSFAVTDTGTCTSCPPNCLRCTVVDGLARCNSAGCAEGFGQHKTGTCMNCADSNCERCFYDDNTNSLLCLPGGCKIKHVLTTEGTCLPCPEGCVKCVLLNGAAKCDTGSACEARFTKSQAGDCLKCPMNCSRCNAVNNETAVCSPGACDNMFAGKADGTACLGCPSNCLECTVVDETNNTTRCSAGSCSAGLSVAENGRCQACSVTVAKCTACTDFSLQTNLTTCRWCQRGFVAKNGMCEECPERCQVCAVDTNNTVYCQPRRCATGNAVIGQTCQECSAHCLECIDAETSELSSCSKCAVGYEINNTTGTCEECDVNCADGCKEQGGARCDGLCKAGYHNDINTHICQKCDLGVLPNCVNCKFSPQQNRPVCTECGSTYGLNDTKCIPCNSTDVKLDNCEKCWDLETLSPHCSMCSTGFGLTENRSCSACDAHCDTTCGLAGAGKCDGSCKPNYTIALNNNTCVDCVHHCIHCNMTTINTTTLPLCLPGGCDKRYTDYEGYCYGCPDNCHSCSFSVNKTVCLQDGCDERFGFVPSSGTCLPCPANCRRCESTVGNDSRMNCSSCDSGFGLAGNGSGVCWACDIDTIGVPYCTNCSDFWAFNSSFFLTTCSDCQDGFFLNKTSLCQHNPCPSFDAVSFVGGILSAAATIFISVVIFICCRRYKCYQCDIRSSSSSSSRQGRPKTTRSPIRRYTNPEYQPFEES